jgi:hypothetical protein
MGRTVAFLAFLALLDDFDEEIARVTFDSGQPSRLQRQMRSWNNHRHRKWQPWWPRARRAACITIVVLNQQGLLPRSQPSCPALLVGE